MRSRHINEYPKSNNEERMLKNSPSTRQQPRVYETIRARLENKDQTDGRKHNSPDMNRYRAGENRSQQQTIKANKTSEN